MGHKDTDLGTLNVSGAGRVLVKPDTALVRLAVITEAKTAAEAVSANATSAQAIIDALHGLGLEDRALQTKGLSVGPIYSYNEATRQNEIAGYRAENAVSATAAIDLAGSIYDAGIGAGANQSSGITFSIGDERPYRKTALQAAVSAANSDAEVVAASLGVKLRGPASVDVDSGGGPVVKTLETNRATTATPVEAGELAVTARVNIAYRYYA